MKDFADLLLGKLKDIRGNVPPKYYNKLLKKIEKLKREAADNFDGEKYTANWAKEGEEIEVEMAFYHYIFNNKELLWYVENIVNNGGSRFMPPKDVFKKIVVYSLLNAGREYEVFDIVFYRFKERYFAPFFERRLLDKYFVKGLYNNLYAYIKDIIGFRLESASVDKEKLTYEIGRFKKTFSIEKYLGKR